MTSLFTADDRFDKPALHTLVDLINKRFCLNLAYADVELVSVESYDGPATTVNDIVAKSRFETKATVSVRLSAEQDPLEYVITYLRLLLPSFLYRNLVIPSDLGIPPKIPGFFFTSWADAATHALEFLVSEYLVEIAAEDCTIESRPDQPALDGSWPVTITPKVDHPLWVGPIVLQAKLGS